MTATTPTGIAVIDCVTCDRRHPVNRIHCVVCGSPSAFAHADHTGDPALTWDAVFEGIGS